MIDSIPIQFIPSSTDLEKEAIKNAILVKYKNVSIKIIKPEYLIAIFLNVYRPKDKDKIIKLLGQAKIDKTFLKEILQRYKLDKKFDEFIKKYYE